MERKTGAFPHLEGYQPQYQDEYTQTLLEGLVGTDQFNAFCVDCQKNKTTHCNITFGVFVCEDCAKFLEKNQPQSEHYIKSLF